MTVNQLSGENQNQLNQQQPQGQQQQQQQQKEMTQVPTEDYARLLDYLENLEDQVKTLQGKPANQNDDGDDVDDLIDEGRGGKKRQQQQQQQQQQQVDYDKMSPSQLVNVMRQEFGAGFAEIKTAIHAIRIERDIEAIMEDEKNSDFELYAEDIVAMMQERPNLKVHEAYVLAKNKDPKRSETKKANDEEQGNRRQRFLGGLPDPRRKSHGERPGAAGSTTGPGTAKTVDDAAERAYEEIFKGKSPNE